LERGDGEIDVTPYVGKQNQHALKIPDYAVPLTGGQLSEAVGYYYPNRWAEDIIDWSGSYYKHGGITIDWSPTRSGDASQDWLSRYVVVTVETSSPAPEPPSESNPNPGRRIVSVKPLSEVIGKPLDFSLASPTTYPSVYKTLTVDLLPVELKNLRDLANSADDVIITPKTNAADTNINSVAWIDNHTSDTDPAPRMPQLRFSIPGLPSDIKIKAKLEVDYTRPYVGHLDQDSVEIPNRVHGEFQDVTGNAWDIYADVDWSTAGFFGGDAKLTYQLTKADGTVLLPNQIILFRIAGQNPDDIKCKDYIVSKSGVAWFAYAIAKHESNLYGGEATYYPFQPVTGGPAKYNQFRALGGGQRGDRILGREGIPLHERAEAAGPGGVGAFQVTGSPTDQTAIIPRVQIWSWQANVDGALAIIQNSIKSGLAARFYEGIKSQSPQSLKAFEEDPAHDITIGRTVFTSDDAIWITAYNGWGGKTKDRYLFRSDLPKGLTISPDTQTKRWYFNPPLNPDEFYIRKVERLLEP
jgi:hypothetical protein